MKLKRIARGMFTICYRVEGTDCVVLDTICPIKHMIADGLFPASPLFPKFNYYYNGEVYLLETKYYPKYRSLKNNLDPDQWKIYQTLRKIYMDTNIRDIPLDNLSEFWENRFQAIEDINLRKVMVEAIQVCRQYIDTICFEISPRNVAIDNGKLILLDVFYDTVLLDELKQKAKEKL